MMTSNAWADVNLPCPSQVRKLEFLLAEAVAGGHDCVVTIGGIQSNHCRATAVAARWGTAQRLSARQPDNHSPQVHRQQLHLMRFSVVPLPQPLHPPPQPVLTQPPPHHL